MNKFYLSSTKSAVLSLKLSRAIRLLMMVLFISLFSNVAAAQTTNTWDGSSNSNWNTPANWSLNLVPTDVHDVVININAAILVDVTTTTTIINSLNICNNALVSFTSIGGGKTITIDNSGSSIVAGSSLTLQGSTGGGTRSMSIAFSGTAITMSIAGNFNLTAVGDGSNYNASNSVTIVTGILKVDDNSGGTTPTITSTKTNLIIGSGGTYKHNINGGTIPLSTWDAASNCEITGVVSANAIAGADGQSFGNFKWNNTGQTNNATLLTTPSTTTTIKGDFSFLASGTGSKELRFIDANGIVLNVNGDFIVNSVIKTNILDLCRGGTITSINISGNWQHLSGTLKANAAIAVNFNSTGIQSFERNAANISALDNNTLKIDFSVQSGSTLQMFDANSILTTDRAFVLSTGATFGVTSEQGIVALNTDLTGNIRAATTRTFITGANYIYNGTTNQAVGTGLPATVNNLTISNGSGVTLGKATTVTNNFSISSGAIANLGTFSHTASILTLGGEGTVQGSWGSTSSLATNKNNIYFAVTATGTVNNNCTAPLITTQPIALTICENTGGMFTVTSSGTVYQWQYSVDNINWINTNSVIGWSGHTSATLTLTNISTDRNGNYVRCIVRSSGGCRTNSTSVLLTVNSPSTPATKTWNGTAWSPAGAPIGSQNIAFAGNYNVVADVAACSCTVTSGIVTIAAGNNLILGSKLTVSGGSLTFENDASLVQTTYTGANTGAIFYKRDTSPVINTDYTYWSSPVAAGYSLGQLSPNTLAGMFYSYNAGIEKWKQEYSATTMNVGVGYIVRGPEPTPPMPPTRVPFSTTFEGVPNNGTIPVTISYTPAIPDLGTSNLIGNPYPSAIDANAFLSLNSSVIEGTLYFWTHNTGSNNGQYNNDDYASFNGTGGAAGTGGVVPSGKIAAGQAFFTTGIANGNAIFTNAMRVSGNNAQFFKTKNASRKTANNIEKNRVWLNLTNSQGAFKQTLIGYVTDATNEFDRLFDGESFDGNEFVDFYSVNHDRNLVIQGRALPFDENDEVPLGYRTTINGDFSINIDQVDGSLTNQAVFLEDKLNNTITDLKSGNYTFNTVAGTFNDRFVLRYTNNKKTLKANNFDSLENTLLVSTKNKQVKVNSFTEKIDKVTIYDIAGRQILHKGNVDSTEISITNLWSNRQALIVKTVLQNGQEVSKKIVY